MSKNYREQLADSRWLQKKTSILIRDSYTCQKCGAKSYLNVHHISYEKGKLAWEYPDGNLITLCQDCHENEHNIVTYPKIGKIYTYYHSEFTNNMICYHIDTKRDTISLFGVDCGAYGTPYIINLTFEQFFDKCRNSKLDFNKGGEDFDTYTAKSLYLAYNELNKHPERYISPKYPYSDHQHIDFTVNKIKKVINSRSDIVAIFNIFALQ